MTAYGFRKVAEVDAVPGSGIWGIGSGESGVGSDGDKGDGEDGAVEPSVDGLVATGIVGGFCGDGIRC